MAELAARIVYGVDLPLSATALFRSLGEWGGNALAAVLTFSLFWVAWWALRSGLGPVLDRTRLDRTTSAFVRTSVKYALMTVGAVAAVGELGVNTASLVASLGVAGLTVGFAARETLANVIAGLFIYWDRPFVIDDLVEVGDHYGRVDRITIRSTRVVTPDGRMLAIPNATAVDSVVASYTNFPHLRVDAPVDVGVGEDLSRVRDLLLDLVREREGFLDDPAPSVAVTRVGDYSVTMTLMAWVEDERSHLKLESELREEAFETLRAAGVDMPYETVSLTPVEVRRGA